MGKLIPFLVDTGATLSCIRRQDLNCPISKTFIQSVGICGVPQREPLSELLQTEIGGIIFLHEFVLSHNSPANLLGRYLLSKVKATVKCSPTGVELYILSDQMYQMISKIVSGWHKTVSVVNNLEFVDKMFTVGGIK